MMQSQFQQLTQQENVRSVSTQFRKYYTRFLPIAQLSHFLHLHLARNTKSTQIFALILSGSSGVDCVEELKRGLIQRQDIHKVLSEAANFEMSMGPDVA